MLTRKLFWENPYLTALDTVVASVDGDAITLRETIFFAFAGGQESDAGTIGGYPVIEAQKSGYDIRYGLPAGHGLAHGDGVRVEIDWHRRYRLMRLHFAAELVLELVCRRLPGVEKIGAHIAVDKARIDFRWPENVAPHFPHLISQAMLLVEQDRVIVSAFSDETKELRYWEIAGFASVPCGGTHVKRTGEVGAVTLKRKNIGKGKERIEVYLIDDAPKGGPL